MATQRHEIRIDAGQDAVFRALSSAEGWSRWITPAVTGDFPVGGEIVCEPNGRVPIRIQIMSLEAGAGGEHSGQLVGGQQRADRGAAGA